MKEQKCIKCGERKWQGKVSGFNYIYQCRKCGYVFDWLDYTTVSKLDASTITANRIMVNQPYQKKK